MIILTTKPILYVRSLGRGVTVTAISSTVRDANKYCATHKDEGVIAQYDGLVIISKCADKGIKLPRSSSPERWD